jgi:hypothetical protein
MDYIYSIGFFSNSFACKIDNNDTLVGTPIHWREAKGPFFLRARARTTLARLAITLAHVVLPSIVGGVKHSAHVLARVIGIARDLGALHVHHFVEEDGARGQGGGTGGVGAVIVDPAVGQGGRVPLCLRKDALAVHGVVLGVGHFLLEHVCRVVHNAGAVSRDVNVPVLVGVRAPSQVHAIHRPARATVAVLAVVVSDIQARTHLRGLLIAPRGKVKSHSPTIGHIVPHHARIDGKHVGCWPRGREWRGQAGMGG